MTIHKVADLPDDLLNLFVAKAEGWTWFRNKRDGVTVRRPDETGFEAGNYRAKYDADTGQRLPEISFAEAVNAYGDLDWTTDWSKGGPIIEREHMKLSGPDPTICDGLTNWTWWSYHGEQATLCEGYGSTPLIAAMRAYVASKFGEAVELP